MGGQDEWVANRTREECNKKKHDEEKAGKNDQNSGNDDDDDQGEATENEIEKLVNVLQNNVSLSFEKCRGNK